MKWNETQESKISSLTIDQVNAAMRKWIQPEKITYIQAGDFEKKTNWSIRFDHHFLHQHFILIAELKDAISGYLQSQSVNRSRDSYLASVLSSNLFLKRTMKWNEAQETKIGALTVDQVNAAMRKWIQPEKITYIQAGDFDKKTNWSIWFDHHFLHHRFVFIIELKKINSGRQIS